MSLVIICIFWVAFEGFISRTKICHDLDRTQDKSTLRILWFTIFISIFLGIYLNRFAFGRVDSLAVPLYYAGIALILLGLVVRWRAISTLKQYFTVNVSIREDHRLIRNDLYRYVRHPAYTGSLISFLGLGISFGNWLSLAVIFVPILISFLHRITIEEKVLADAFGEDYEQYSEETSRLIPGIY